MIRGEVNDHNEAVVPLRLRGPTGLIQEIGTVVDTGFSSSLTLSEEIATALGLEFESTGEANLADGSTCEYAICPVDMEWNGDWRTVLAWVFGGGPLLGMRQLTGHKLIVNVEPSGQVEISPLE
jgi:clan AA aspartic protease